MAKRAGLPLSELQQLLSAADLERMYPLKTSIIDGRPLPENRGEYEEVVEKSLAMFLKCVKCHFPFTETRVHTPAGWRETQITGMCEDCFDAAVGEG